MKPLGHKAYGSIPHLPGSKRGPADRGLGEAQARILTHAPRRGDRVIVQEKLDGTNVAVAKIEGQIVPLVRAGWRAESSPFEQHHLFASYVLSQWERWDRLLREGERLSGEWLAQAHGTRYDLSEAEPFFAFDLMRGQARADYDEFRRRFAGEVQLAPRVGEGPMTVEEVMQRLGREGLTGLALEPVEGAVWRVERDGRVDFLAKYVRPDFETGKYLEGPEVWNWHPDLEGG